MHKSASTVIYNMAFAPKLRSINLRGLANVYEEGAEALIKLLKISGAIEYLNLCSTSIEWYIPDNDEFFIALGSNKTLRYLNLDRFTGEAKYDVEK